MGLIVNSGPSTATRRKPFTPSPQQADFLGALEHSEAHILLEARAGSGKSTTCREGAHALGRRKSIYCCFNKHIQREFQPDLPQSCRAATLHSLGYQTLRENQVACEIDADKVDRLTEQYFPNKWERSTRLAVARLVGVCKNTLADDEDADVLAELAAVHDVRIPAHRRDDVFGTVSLVMDDCLRETATIDFDDMIWLPVANGMRPTTSPDVLFVDEAQDLNPCQHALVDLLCPEGRQVVVGDRWQSIYAFRGADAHSIPKLQSKLSGSDRGLTTLPLTVTRRCPASVTALARRLVADLEAMPDAPLGVVRSVEPQDWTAAVDVGDMILCRTNAPLVAACYQLWSADVRARIVGRDVGRSLVALLDSFRSPGLGELIRALDDYRIAEVQKLSKLRNPAGAINALNDRCECLKAMTVGARTVQEVRDRIGRMFVETTDSNVVTLSSIHRAKGLERDHVVILRPDLLPGPWATTPDELQQEANLLYVAITRSKSRLTFAGDVPESVAC